MAKFSKETHCKFCSLKLNIFRYLTTSELEAINEARYEVYFNKGETIFKQGGPLSHVVCLTSGMAKVYLEGENNKNIILKILKPTELVGGPGFQVDNRHHFSVSAIADSRACLIDFKAFEAALKDNIHFNLEFISHLNKATIHLYNKLSGLTGKNMHGRIAEALLYLSKNIYQDTSFTTTLSRQDLADMAALTKESTIRILKDFKNDHVIDFEGNSLKILDMEKLEGISRTS
ncbi:MAG: Crp/Fnr family transcriptional regulator [Bacteroidales bacterium]|nr:Crp/Fnr family transcriptional regulator [Bacteroidales bacterium]MCF8404736.1 Crp/Fnr family transcriptional regulator [Bacteroidales bacterium]